MGATGFGYDLARQFGLNIVAPRPALVPLVFHPADRKRYSDLAGVSTEVIASAGNAAFPEKMLFTHRGLSGPAILQASSYWKEGEFLQIDLAPGREATQKIREAGTRTAAVAEKALREFLPSRLAERWLKFHPPKAWTNTALDVFERELHSWQVQPAGTEGYEKAEVTAGGVDTAELSSKSMESRKVPGLFFIGEVVDVTGHLGGFNFQWAWASATAAGRAL
jgi:predicted Rossmann fold flavoprotein